MKLWILIFICLAATSTNAAKAQLIQVRDTPKTIGETLQINSKRLSEQRELHIYLPASYASSKHRYPVIYTRR
jgi:enterochelin esterase-like enzyme